ncbi:MAG: NADH-quinone oxidoreductase subunit A [Planctomycetaceae bacterium]|nr:MAG: NADH-quinone oxidoreductase subunit A [Planctomycetaceae bacterium]
MSESTSMHPVLIAGYVALFVAVGAAFLCVNMLVGWLVRPRLPNTEKLEVYECGEPAIGSSFVQFDLRFYVVALLFIIFDVEVALFFPWATVFGKAVQLSDPSLVTVQETLPPQAAQPLQATLPSASLGVGLSPAAIGLFKELGLSQPAIPQFVVPPATLQALEKNRGQRSLAVAEGEWSVARAGALLARSAVCDMAVFFAVLLVGFAYVWNRGDLNWVRAVSTQRPLLKAQVRG